MWMHVDDRSIQPPSNQSSFWRLSSRVEQQLLRLLTRWFFLVFFIFPLASAALLLQTSAALPSLYPAPLIGHFFLSFLFSSQGSTLGLLTRTALGAWSLSALRVVLRRERALPVATPPTRGSSSRRRRRSSGSGRKRRSSSRSKGRRRKGRGTTGGVEEGDSEEEEARATVPEESHRQVCEVLVVRARFLGCTDDARITRG